MDAQQSRTAREQEIRDRMRVGGYDGDCRELADVAWLLAALSSLREERDTVKGAMVAQDEREQRAGALCGVPWAEHGCDWPDAVAEEVCALREERDRLLDIIGKLRAETTHDEACHPSEGYHSDRCKRRRELFALLSATPPTPGASLRDLLAIEPREEDALMGEPERAVGARVESLDDDGAICLCDHIGGFSVWLGVAGAEGSK